MATWEKIDQRRATGLDDEGSGKRCIEMRAINSIVSGSLGSLFRSARQETPMEEALFGLKSN